MSSFDEIGAMEQQRLEERGGRDWAVDDYCPPFPPPEAYAPNSGAVHNKATLGAFQFTCVGDLEYRAPEFLIDGLIETDSLGMIFGDPGCGKSFIGVDLALCVATGADFHGRSVKQGPVLFIAGEGHNGLTRRFHAWSKERNTPLNNVPLFKSERAAQFLDAASAKAVADAADALASRHGAPQLIIVDTVARNFGAGDENSTQDMSNFIVAIDDLKARYPGCVVLLIHHSGHADKGRARGAMALKGALDFEFGITKEGSSLKVANTKMKDAEPPADQWFTLESVALRGDTTSAVLRGADAPERKNKLTPAMAQAIAAYEAAALAGGTWDDEGRSFKGVHTEAWREPFYKKHTGDNADAKKKTFQRVRKDLVESGRMTVTDDTYLINDQDIQSRIYAAGKPDNQLSGTSGT